MPLPPEIDKQIRDRFQAILSQAQQAVSESSDELYFAVRTQLFSLMNFISPNSDHFGKLRDEIAKSYPIADYTDNLLGYVKGVKASYEAGMFFSLSAIIEANIASDYMGQAEQLLGEGIPGQFDHVPAAVLAGAVFEDALRRLCQRQTPPISLMNANGTRKTLEPLITDLQQASAFNKAKADLYRFWAKTRNYAAHGEFSQFRRQDVDDMIAGIKRFLAEHM